MRFVTSEQVRDFFNDKTVAIVGSAPSSLENPMGFVDSHDIVVRVNNYKTGNAQGKRCDVHYSFYGTSIRKRAIDLIYDGVQLCMCKCPNSKPLESPWHEQHRKLNGIDFRYIYEMRKDWWFCDTYIPSDGAFMEKFHLLQKHVPTTGFSTILDVLLHNPKSVYLTGFDFFTSGIHNVDEPWTEKNLDDPICHRPDLELEWLANNLHGRPIFWDKKLGDMLVHSNV